MEHLVISLGVCVTIIGCAMLRQMWLKWRRWPVQGPPSRFGNVGKR